MNKVFGVQGDNNNDALWHLNMMSELQGLTGIGLKVDTIVC